MVTSFADGTKVSEQAVVANATGMTGALRGMHGYTVEAGTPLMEAARLWNPEALLQGPGSGRAGGAFRLTRATN